MAASIACHRIVPGLMSAAGMFEVNGTTTLFIVKDSSSNNHSMRTCTKSKTLVLQHLQTTNTRSVCMCLTRFVYNMFISAKRI
jgi:hypothetical protein